MEQLKEELIKQDLYEAVNGAWIAQAEIPADKPATGGFNDLAEGIEKTLMSDFDAMTEEDVKDNELMKEFLNFYHLAHNFEKHEADGLEDLKKELAIIENIHSLNELSDLLPALFKENLSTPFDLDITADMKDANLNVLFASVPSLILPDKTSYSDENPQKETLLTIYQDMVTALFEKVGKTTEEAAAIAKGALDFDASMVPFVKSAEESSEYAKSYNPEKFLDFAKHSQHLDFQRTIVTLLGATPETVIVTEPEFFNHFDDMVNSETFNNLKSWILARTMISLAKYTTEEMRQLSGSYRKALSGLKELMSPKKNAFYLSIGWFSHVVGDYYGKRYFGEQAKNDVTEMIHTMIAIYQSRLKNNTWLSEATRNKAVEKLDAITIKVGYPDEIDDFYHQLKVKDGSLLENILSFTKMNVTKSLSEWNKPVDKKRWGMSANIVNAYYSPSQNEIVFPAAILQAPFYSLSQGSAANYGGIGAVIAHEISHAFDNNGAQFDEKGNLNNWWTEADLKHFQGLAQQMIDQFDGLETEAGRVNGKLTVSENIADAGGLSCALEALKQEENPDLHAFFVNWAKVWRMKARIEYQQMLLAFDVHAPAKLRANVQVKNLDDFYPTFDVKTNDPMYLPREKRVHIW